MGRASAGGASHRRQHGGAMTNAKSAIGRTLVRLVLTVSILTPALARSATLVSDRPDYAPGEIVTLTGAGFEPGEWVVMQVQHDDGTPDSGENHGTWLVQADPEDGLNPGGFVTTWTVCGDDCLGSTLRATAIGYGSGLDAWVVFTDASQCGCTGGGVARVGCPLTSDIAGACYWGCGHLEGNGTLQCSPNRYDYATTGTECRSAAGACDVAETCSGSSGTCPADDFLPSSTVCRTAAGEC